MNGGLFQDADGIFYSPEAVAQHAIVAQHGHSTPEREAARMIADGGESERRAREWMGRYGLTVADLPADEVGRWPAERLGPEHQATIRASMSFLELANELVRVAGYDRLYKVLLALNGRLGGELDAGDACLVVTTSGAVFRGKCDAAGPHLADIVVLADNAQDLNQRFADEAEDLKRSAPIAGPDNYCWACEGTGKVETDESAPGLDPCRECGGSGRES